MGFLVAQGFTPGSSAPIIHPSLLQEAYVKNERNLMSHVFHQLYYHFTWATHSREPLVDRAWRPKLLEILDDEVKTRGGFPIRHHA